MARVRVNFARLFKVFWKKHKRVKSFRVGGFGEGEMGVTVVELK